MDYLEFIQDKHLRVAPCGLDVDELSDGLFDYQHAVVKWALKKGRKFIGAELKESYWKQAVANLQSVQHEQENNLFTSLEVNA